MDVWSVCTKKVVFAYPDQIIANAVEIMSVNRIRRIPIIEQRHLAGIMTSRDILEVFENKPTLEGLSMRLDEVMKRNVITIDPYADVQEAARLMLEKDIGNLPVVVRGTEEIVGIVTERDLIGAFSRKVSTGLDIGTLGEYSEFLQEIPYCEPDLSIGEAMKKLRKTGLRRMLVKDTDPTQELGIFSVTDIIHLFSFHMDEIRRGDTDPLIMPVGTITKRPIFSLPQETPIREALDLMLEEGYGTVIVTDDGEVVGGFTERSILNILRDKGGIDTAGGSQG